MACKERISRAADRPESQGRNLSALTPRLPAWAAQTSPKPPLPRQCVRRYPGKGSSPGRRNESAAILVGVKYAVRAPASAIGLEFLLRPKSNARGLIVNRL